MGWVRLVAKLLQVVMDLIDVFIPEPDKPSPTPPTPNPPPKPPVPGPTPPPPAIDDPVAVRQELLAWHNRERRDQGAVTLFMHKELNILAQRQANYQASIAGWRDLHGRPPGHSLGSDMKEVTFSYRTYGENAAAGQRSATQVCEAWKRSSGHYRNMINKNFSYVGFGYAISSKGTPYWIAIFAG